jgi:hypothetical protein
LAQRFQLLAVTLFGSPQLFVRPKTSATAALTPPAPTLCRAVVPFAGSHYFPAEAAPSCADNVFVGSAPAQGRLCGDEPALKLGTLRGTLGHLALTM